MSTTTIKSARNNNQFQNEVVIQITKKQLINFFRMLLVFSFLIINVLAFLSNSLFVKELLIGQAIVLMVIFVKYSNSNTILR
jgi:hypothetical protein